MCVCVYSEAPRSSTVIQFTTLLQVASTLSCDVGVCCRQTWLIVILRCHRRRRRYPDLAGDLLSVEHLYIVHCEQRGQPIGVRAIL